MAITVNQLAQALQTAYDTESVSGALPGASRATIAQKQAAAIAAFVIGRETQVTGVTVQGVALTGNGIILG